MSVVHNVSVEDQYQRVRLALSRLRDLPEGWDGNGAMPPSKWAIERANTVVSRLAKNHDLPVPRVAALADGAVQIAWTKITRNGRLELEARFLDDSNVLTIGYAHLPGFEFEDEVDSPDRLAELVQQRLLAERG